MEIILLVGILAITGGLLASLYYLSKGLYLYSVYKKEQLFNNDYKEYKEFSKELKNIYKKDLQIKK